VTAKQQSQMEWSSHVTEDKYFIRICIVTLIAFVALSIAIPLITIPPIDKSTVKPMPQRFAKLILEKKKEIKKPEKQELTEAEKAALKKAAEERRKRLEEERKKREAERKKREAELKKKREEERKKAEAERKKREAELKKKREEERKKSAEDRKKAEAERKRQEAARKKAEAEQQRQEAARQKAEAERQRQEAAREAARQHQAEIRRQAEAERKRVAAEKQRIAEEKRKGEALAASLFGDLADLPNEPIKSTSGNNTLITKTERNAAAETLSSPNVLTSKTAGSRQGSGGIDATQMAQLDIGAGIDVTLENRSTTVIEEVDLGILDGNDSATVTADGRPIRSRRELNTALERKKGRIYKIYQRALRKDPTLGGKVVLRLTILPTGDVESVEIVSSDIDVDSFLRKLKTLIKGIKFPNRNVPTVVVNYPIDFGAL